jgi:light-regulated signal transduction histidine kinase (bacteriophytochrome)
MDQERRGVERQLRRRTAELEALNRELDAFCYSVSHDLRAPLRAISGFSKVLIEDFHPELTPEAQRCVERVSSGAEQMGRLVDDLLRLSRLGRRPVSKTRLAPAPIVREVIAALEVNRQERSVEFTVRDLPECWADPGLLRQVFVNLLSNAVKFTRDRNPAHIEVGSVQDGPAPVYYVKDNGCGFDMQHAGKLFGVFQRLHTPQDYEGTGAGLAIVRRIVERHGGRVWAEAEPGRGATFYFTLEAHDETPKEPRAATAGGSG